MANSKRYHVNLVGQSRTDVKGSKSPKRGRKSSKKTPSLGGGLKLPAKKGKK